MSIAAILKEKGREVFHVPPSTTVAQLVRVLRDNQVGAVLVLEVDSAIAPVHEGQILGIVSERDVVRALAVTDSASDVLDMTASQIMTEVRTTIPLDARLSEAGALMTSRRVRHLPVLDGDILVGMVSIGDVVLARLGQMPPKQHLDTRGLQTQSDSTKL